MCFWQVGMQIAGNIAEYQGAKNAAKANAKHAVSSYVAAEKYRLDVVEYQNEQFSEDLAYVSEAHVSRKQDFGRQVAFVDKADAAIRKDFFRQIASLATRQMEEAMAATFDVEGYSRAGRGGQSTARASSGDRGVSGNSVDAVVNDILRQSGEATTARRLQLSATGRQLDVEAEGLKAQADTELMNLPSQIYAPLALPRRPAPVAPTGLPGPIGQPSFGAVLFGAGQAAAKGYSDHVNGGGNDFLKIGVTPRPRQP